MAATLTTAAPARNPLRKLASNALVPMAARVFDLGFALVYLRFLDPNGTAVYQFIVVLTTYLDTLIDFGLNALMAREISRNPAAAAGALRRVSLLRLAFWLLGVPVVAVAFGPARVRFDLPPEATLAGWLFYLALLPSILAKGATGLLWGFERLEITGLVSVLGTLLKTGFGVVALVLGLGVVGLALSSVAVNLVSASLLALAVRRPLAARFNAADTPAPLGYGFLLRESWPLFVNQILQGLFFKIDSLLLPPLAGTFQAGAYAAAYKVNEGAGAISSSFTLALFPSLSRHAEASPERLARSYQLAVRLLLAISFPLATGAALLAEPIMNVVGGRAYLPSAAIALAVLIWYLPFSYVNGLTQYVLIAAGRQRYLTGAFVAALLFNLAGNAVAIPRYGFVGAAVVTVLSELVLLGPFQYATEQVAPGVSLLRAGRGPLLATLLMAPVVWWLRDAPGAWAAILAGLLVYPLALVAVGGVSLADWHALR